jgi:hypothetical protein
MCLLEAIVPRHSITPYKSKTTKTTAAAAAATDDDDTAGKTE